MTPDEARAAAAFMEALDWQVGVGWLTAPTGTNTSTE